MKISLNSLLLLIVTCGMFSSCSSVSLSHDEAKTLVISALKLPHPASIDFKIRQGRAQYREGLLDEGIIEYVNGWLELTERGRGYLLETGTYGDGYPLVKLKTCDLDFNEITGIAINKEQETATVRFTVKALNITPVGLSCVPDIDKPMNEELVFKKFDNGWQIESKTDK